MNLSIAASLLLSLLREAAALQQAIAAAQAEGRDSLSNDEVSGIADRAQKSLDESRAAIAELPQG